MGGYRKGVHQPHRYREREDVRRRPYLEKEISEEHFAPCTVFNRLSLFGRRYAPSPFPSPSSSSLDYRVSLVPSLRVSTYRCVCAR